MEYMDFGSSLSGLRRGPPLARTDSLYRAKIERVDVAAHDVGNLADWQEFLDLGFSMSHEWDGLEQTSPVTPSPKRRFACE